MVTLHQTTTSELHPSAKPFIAALVILAISLVFLYVPNSDALVEVGILFLVFALYILSAGLWVLDSWRRQFGRWGTVAVWVGVAALGFGWLGLVEFLPLLIISLALAAVLLGTGAAIITVIIESILLIILWQYAPVEVNSAAIFMTLIVLWLMLGVMTSAYHAIYQTIEWFQGYFQNARHLLEEARERKVRLEQTLNDLAHANRDLLLLNERLDAMRHIAEEAQKAKTAFVAKISHEFRTPLNMIIGLIDTLTETPDVYGQILPPELLKDLEIVHRNSNHLASMINDVLDLSQTEVGRLTLHREWVNLAEDINTALTVVQPLLDKKKLELQVNIAGDLPQVYCDKTRIRQVILNLVSNAARYTERGGITVYGQQQGQSIVINVSDTGPGISPEDLERIFDPFCQGAESMWRDQGGSGLGLSISKQFIERHNGQIWVESQLGVGSTFSFKLPIFPSSAPTAGPHRWVSEDWVFLERTSWPNLPTSPYNQRIILCDETGDLYPTFTRLFDDIEFIDTATLPQTARELKNHPAHAVIINTALPKTLQHLMERARQEIVDTPLVGCSLPLKTNHILEAGAVDYLIKPIMQRDLKDTIEALDTRVKKILIVDDNPDFRQLLTRMLLIYDKSVEISAVSSGGEAIETLRNNPPDLMLLDIAMPDMTGWEVLSEKQNDDTLAEIPVIMVTAEDPTQQPSVSNVMMVTSAQGLSINQILQCSLYFSKLLLEQDLTPDPAPEQTAADAPVLANKQPHPGPTPVPLA